MYCCTYTKARTARRWPSTPLPAPSSSALDLQVMGRLAAAGYRVITSADVFPEELRGLDREMRALVEYFVGLEANK